MIEIVNTYFMSVGRGVGELLGGALGQHHGSHLLLQGLQLLPHLSVLQLELHVILCLN